MAVRLFPKLRITGVQIWDTTAAEPGRTQRMKRAKKHYERLAKKAANETTHDAGPGIVGTVKKAVAGAAHAVGAAVHAVADTLAGKKEESVKKD